MNRLLRVAQHRLSFSQTAKMSGLIAIESEKQFNDLLSSSKPFIVDFSATWCPPCRALGPVLDQVAMKNPSIPIIKIDTDKFPSIAAKYQVGSIPYVIMLKDGNIVDSFVGAKDASFVQSFLDKNVSK